MSRPAATTSEVPSSSAVALGCEPAGRVLARVGGEVWDLAALQGLPIDPSVWTAGSLEGLFRLGPSAWQELVMALPEVVRQAPERARLGAVVPELGLPVHVGNFADFYSSRHHAERMAHLMRPGTALPPAWSAVPLGYFSRAGALIPSGAPLLRPWGVRSEAGEVLFGPSSRLDVEMELGFLVGRDLPRGARLDPEQAQDYVFGVVLVADWSARDIQAFESNPLGPFLGKSFATSVSTWVVPLACLAHARVEGPPQDPVPLPHLRAPEPRGLELEMTLEVNQELVGHANSSVLYWSFGQQLAHLCSNGSGLQAGDLFASGTVSGPEPTSCGCLMERYGGERWLEDGDEVRISARAGEVELGEVRAVVTAAGGSPQGQRRQR